MCVNLFSITVILPFFITTGSKLPKNDQKTPQSVKHQYAQQPQNMSLVSQHQGQEDEIGVKVVQATTATFSDSQDTSLLPDLSNIDMMSLPIDIEEPEPEINVEDIPCVLVPVVFSEIIFLIYISVIFVLHL